MTVLAYIWFIMVALTLLVSSQFFFGVDATTTSMLQGALYLIVAAIIFASLFYRALFPERCKFKAAPHS